jgi:hypothetical protein
MPGDTFQIESFQHACNLVQNFGRITGLAKGFDPWTPTSDARVLLARIDAIRDHSTLSARDDHQALVRFGDALRAEIEGVQHAE